MYANAINATLRTAILINIILQIDSPFQLTEHLKSLHTAALHRSSDSTITPIDRNTALRLATPPDGIDKYLWLYELCRLLCKEINAVILALFADSPPCSAQTCNEMRASEWQYLCAVHDPPKPCCAIDYCCHTLDWTNSVLTSQKNFPSRMGLSEGGAGGGNNNSQLRQLTNIFRRVYRIFAHAWFQHREMYWKVELKSGLYVFFKTVCDVYNLIPEDNYTVPPEAEGIEPPPATQEKKPKIMKREEESEPHLKAPVADGATTKRHRHTPSVGNESITTVLEDPEEDDDKNTAEKLEETVILSSEPPAYEPEPASEPPITNLAPAEDPPSFEAATATETPTQAEETSAEVPIISVAETAITPEEKTTDPVTEQPEAVPTIKDEGEVIAEQVASSAASDTDSHGSWQVLTNEQTSTEATPASSVTAEEPEVEVKSDEPIEATTDATDVAAESSEEKADSPATATAKEEAEAAAAKVEEEPTEEPASTTTADVEEADIPKPSVEAVEPSSEVPEELKHLVDAKTDVPEVKTEDTASSPVDALSKSERRKSKIPRAVSPAVKKAESPKPEGVKEE